MLRVGPDLQHLRGVWNGTMLNSPSASLPEPEWSRYAGMLAPSWS